MPTSNRARRWKRIARLYNNGCTRREIGDRLDLDPARVGAATSKSIHPRQRLEDRTGLLGVRYCACSPIQPAPTLALKKPLKH